MTSYMSTVGVCTVIRDMNESSYYRCFQDNPCLHLEITNSLKAGISPAMEKLDSLPAQKKKKKKKAIKIWGPGVIASPISCKGSAAVKFLSEGVHRRMLHDPLKGYFLNCVAHEYLKL